MNLTQAQLQTFKSHILANPAVQPFLPPVGNYQAIANHYNEIDAEVVWRTNTTLDEIQQSDTFDWIRVDNLSVGKSRIWEWLFSNEGRAIDPSKLNVRKGIDETWKGTTADLDVRAAVYEKCRRQSTHFEALYATGGAGNATTPNTLGLDKVNQPIEGDVTFQIVMQALAS